MAGIHTLPNPPSPIRCSSLYRPIICPSASRSTAPTDPTDPAPPVPSDPSGPLTTVGLESSDISPVGDAMNPPASSSARSNASTSARSPASPAHARSSAAPRSAAGMSATSRNTRRARCFVSPLIMSPQASPAPPPAPDSDNARYSTARAYRHTRAPVRADIPSAADACSTLSPA